MPELRTSHSNEVGDEDVDISVVMACYTEERLPSIDAAVASLRRQTLKPRAVIIAVDNNESLAHLLRKRFDRVTVVLNRSNRGASSTRNRGVEEVATEFTAFLDDDETADPDWLLELIQPFAEPDVVGTGGKYKAAWPTVKPSWFPEEFAWVVGGSYEGLPTDTAPVRNVWSGNMAVRTDAFRRVGGFRTNLSKCGSTPQPEDTDLCIRMAAATGGRWMYVPTATINHIVPRSRASLGFFISRCFAEGRGKAVMVKKLELVSAAAINTERDYAWKAVRVALGRLSSLRWAANLQGLVMLLGLASAASGYLSSFLGLSVKQLRTGKAEDLVGSLVQTTKSPASRPTRPNSPSYRSGKSPSTSPDLRIW
jgi:GT2 family glycosyltransferase